MGFLSKFFGGDKRNDRIAAWSKTIPLTPLQQESMWELYQSLKAGVLPSADPLQKLTKEDKEYILKICGSDFRPAEFGNADTFRLAVFRDLKLKGYSAEQSAVLLGMMFNMIGRKDL